MFSNPSYETPDTSSKNNIITKTSINEASEAKEESNL